MNYNEYEPEPITEEDNPLIAGLCLVILFVTVILLMAGIGS